MTTRSITPHGLHVPCNWYCQGDHHAVIVLGETMCDDGFPSTPSGLIEGCAPYYASLGWKVLSAKRIEADREQIFTTMQHNNNGPVRIDPFSIDERPIPPVVDNFEPWMLLLCPLENV